MKKFHYVYMIVEISTEKMYIGSRSSDVHPNDDLGHHYFSSSRDHDFILNQRTNPSNYKYIVIDTFNDRRTANMEEVRLHETLSVSNSDMYFNLAEATHGGFIFVGKVAVKDKYGNVLLVSIDDEKYKSGELMPVNNKKVRIDGIIYNNVKEAKKSLSMCNKTIKKRCLDSRYSNYEYIS